LHAVLDVGEAIPVSPERDRKAAVDPLMVEIEASLNRMLARLAEESPLFADPLQPSPAAPAVATA
jgi:hypothetical protein